MSIIAKEGFVCLRIWMVIGCLSPVFLVWAIRGNNLLSDGVLWTMAGIAILGPALALGRRFNQVRKSDFGGNLQKLTVRRLTDRREHLLSYLFPVLLSFWAIDFTDRRELYAFAVVMLFTGIAFWHLQLIYVNLWQALFGYRSVQVELQGAQQCSLRPIILLTKNHRLTEGQDVNAWRLTNNLYLEKRD